MWFIQENFALIRMKSESQIPNHPRCNNVVPKTRTAILDKKSQTTHHEGMNSRGVRIHQEFLIWPVATIMV